jgi:hypothetical protein
VSAAWHANTTPCMVLVGDAAGHCCLSRVPRGSLWVVAWIGAAPRLLYSTLLHIVFDIEPELLAA